jgi:uncharacterized protein YdhG (YjbR/CyaY superfamily)
MTTETIATESDGFSAAERAAMKQRAAELRAEGKSGAKRADGLQAVLDSIATMEAKDRALAERVHVTVTAHAPDLSPKIDEMPEADKVLAEAIHAIVTEHAPQLLPKTWYGMPAYANADGKVVLAFKNAGKFGLRYSTLEFQDPAHLDDGDMWPVSYAIETWTPAVEKKVAELVTAAIS